MRRKYLLGVSPQDDFTDKIIAQELPMTCSEKPQVVFDNSGNEAKIYVVDHSFITKLKKKNTTLNFKVYFKISCYPWRTCDPGKMTKSNETVGK